MKTSFYVDNYLDSVGDVDLAISRSQRLSQMLLKGGFHLTKWLSSSRAVMSAINVEERIKLNLELDFDPLPIEKTLGIYWNSKKDCLIFKLSPDRNARTKRQNLSIIIIYLSVYFKYLRSSWVSFSCDSPSKDFVAANLERRFCMGRIPSGFNSENVETFAGFVIGRGVLGDSSASLQLHSLTI